MIMPKKESRSQNKLRLRSLNIKIYKTHIDIATHMVLLAIWDATGSCTDVLIWSAFLNNSVDPINPNINPVIATNNNKSKLKI